MPNVDSAMAFISLFLALILFIIDVYVDRDTLILSPVGKNGDSGLIWGEFQVVDFELIVDFVQVPVDIETKSFTVMRKVIFLCGAGMFCT